MPMWLRLLTKLSIGYWTWLKPRLEDSFSFMKHSNRIFYSITEVTHLLEIIT